ncbi:hypothetical protein ACTFIZ_007248 [Dictyostelium cf. discoideum]
MDYKKLLNNLVIERKINILKHPNHSSLHFKIDQSTNKEGEIIYMVNLNLEIENLPIKTYKTGWSLNLEEAKNECCKEVYLYLITQPSVGATPEKKSLINGITLRLIIILSILLLLILVVPFLFYFLLPFIFILFIILLVPYILYGNNRIVKNIGEKEYGVVRKCKSYDYFKCPIKNTDKGEYLIDLSVNDIIEIQDVSNDNFLAIAENEINLILIPTQINSHKIKIYTFQKGRELRIRKSKGIYSCTMRILLEEGIELTYYNSNIPKEYFTETDLPILKVMSKNGIHYFPNNLLDPIEMKNIEKYQIIIEIHFSWLVSFLFKNN